MITLKNMTIKGGDIKAAGSVLRDGGAISADWYGGLTLDNVTITGSTAARGGGIYVYNLDGGLTITNSTISNNTAYYYSNFGGYGGGIYVRDTDTVITGTTMDSNTINGSGGNGQRY